MKLNYHLVNPYDLDHVGFLYLLLSHRRNEENISHKEMPLFSQHKVFVEKNTYKSWDIVYLTDDSGEYDEKIGSVYVTHKNEIGIHLLQQHQNKGYGKEILEWILKGENPPFYANINPANEKSIKLFQRAGFVPIQITYKLC